MYELQFRALILANQVVGVVLLRVRGCLGFGVQGSGFGIGFRVQSSGTSRGLEFRVS